MNTPNITEKSKLLDGYISEAEFCNQLGVKLRTARSWRLDGRGPPWVRIGDKIYYQVAAFQRWLTKRQVGAGR